ncbi:MAG: hypothetical protein FWD39_01220 [Clostridiales bacterium]|nr:hypothetical protein [Clostridiales bacterium]
MNADLAKFEIACTLKGAYDEVGDSKKGNKQYDIIRSVYLLLKKENRLEEMLELLGPAKNPYVRAWAAGYTLQISPREAEKTLKELIRIGKKSVCITERKVAFDAEMTLEGWKEGELPF